MPRPACLALSGVDCFASSGKVHTLWAGVAKEPLLVHLQGKIERALVRAGIEPERRKFKPHVTLARFRSGAPDRLGPYFQRHSRFSSEPFLVDRFVLFRSHLGSEGAHYEVLATYPLKWGATSESPSKAAPPCQCRAHKAGATRSPSFNRSLPSIARPPFFCSGRAICFIN